ncbi:MAG TPA: hypothetical protein VFL70_06280 [Bacteroidia bacterium]|nr:hypothetical protein [Bacteroidia bacterium]
MIGLPFRDINKLEILKKALSFNIKIPATIVTNNKVELLSFYTQQKSIICKPISNSNCIRIDHKTMSMYTKEIDSNHINSLPNEFLPFIFQKKIDKEYEIRVFYLKPNFYSMAIFSQSDEKTKIDFRNYNLEHPNRIVPFNLPLKIKKSLSEFLISEKINCASIDIIKSTDGNYYFLEINPWGQFGMLSKACNYYIEKKLAEIL